LKLVLLWGPVLLVMGLIFFFSSLPDPGGPPGGISDKTAHVLIYAALGASLVRALAGGRITAMTLTRILFAAALGTLRCQRRDSPALRPAAHTRHPGRRRRRGRRPGGRDADDTAGASSSGLASSVRVRTVLTAVRRLRQRYTRCFADD